MTVRLHLIWGATTTGKTGLAVERALASGAPVIALDRVQCCVGVEMGSGRPTPAELQGTVREYLCDRPVSDGVVTAEQSHRLLVERVGMQARLHDLLILEGGSVSLLNAMVRSPYWSEKCEWVLQRVPLPDEDRFMRRALLRVESMVCPPEGGAGMLHELAALWGDPRNHAVLEDIDGYRQVIRLARERGWQPDRMVSLGGPDLAHLVRRIAREYWEHALWQEREFLPIPATWNIAARVPARIA